MPLRFLIILAIEPFFNLSPRSLRDFDLSYS